MKVYKTQNGSSTVLLILADKTEPKFNVRAENENDRLSVIVTAHNGEKVVGKRLSFANITLQLEDTIYTTPYIADPDIGGFVMVKVDKEDLQFPPEPLHEFTLADLKVTQ